MNYPVESGHPPPRTWTRGPGSEPECPWREMSPGDSFFVPNDTKARRPLADRMRSVGSAWCSRNRPDLRCSVAIEDGGVRVWFGGSTRPVGSRLTQTGVPPSGGAFLLLASGGLGR